MSALANLAFHPHTHLHTRHSEVPHHAREYLGQSPPPRLLIVPTRNCRLTLSICQIVIPSYPFWRFWCQACIHILAFLLHFWLFSAHIWPVTLIPFLLHSGGGCPTHTHLCMVEKFMWILNWRKIYLFKFEIQSKGMFKVLFMNLTFEQWIETGLNIAPLHCQTLLKTHLS